MQAVQRCGVKRGEPLAIDAVQAAYVDAVLVVELDVEADRLDQPQRVERSEHRAYWLLRRRGYHAARSMMCCR